MAPVNSTPRPCRIEGCIRPHLARGLCGAHYHRWERHGDPLAGGMQLYLPVMERFRIQTQIAQNGCILYIGYRNNTGYGRIHVGKRMVLAHIFAYEAAKGRVPTGLVLDHLCRNPPCVNVEHLEAVTQRVNMQRALMKQVCKRGHRLESPNLYFKPNGSRDCRECALFRAKRWKQKRRAERVT